MIRILLTGFEPFPGAPYNPTPKLVERLLRLRRPALQDVTRIGHVFPVTYEAIDQELPALTTQHRPHALLMFGLATRTRHMRIETRARNTITQIWPDASHMQVRSRTLEPGAAASRRFGSHTAQLLRAVQDTGIDARPSISTGFYLCNYLSWRAIEATESKDGPLLAAFVHVPLVRRDVAYIRKESTRLATFKDLVDAGEAALTTMVKLTRQAQLKARI